MLRVKKCELRTCEQPIEQPEVDSVCIEVPVLAGKWNESGCRPPPAPTFFNSSQEGFRLTLRNQDPGAQNRCPSPSRARIVTSRDSFLRWSASRTDSNGVRVLLGLIS